MQALQRFLIWNYRFKATSLKNQEYGNCPKKDTILNFSTDVLQKNFNPGEQCPEGKISNCESIGDSINICPNLVSKLIYIDN